MSLPRTLPSRRRPVGLAAVVLAVALALAGLTSCGGTSPAAGPTDATTSPTAAGAGDSADSDTITVTAVDFSFVVERDTLPAGTYQLRLVNEGGATHDLVVERDGADVAAIAPIDRGDEATQTVDLEPGEYVFYCSIANHRAMGMEITVTVT